MNKQKICWYSAAAAVFAANPIVSDAQMVFTNLDPDIDVYDGLPIDLNGDGNVELVFDQYNYWTFTSYYLFSASSIVMLNYAEIATSADILQLAVGDMVSDALAFSSGAEFLFFSGNNWDGSIDINVGEEWLGNDSYIGLRFDLAGETHYGWMRVYLYQPDFDELPVLKVKEYAYNATPDAPAPIQLYTASTAQFPVLSDMGETNTATDLQLSFQKAADESTVSAYRVILYTGVSTPTLAEANAVTADRYTEILPTGADILLNFDETTRDIDGNLLLAGTNYRVVILSVADGAVVFENDLSLASNSMEFILRSAPVAEYISFTSTGYENDITGFDGSYYLTDLSVASVRAFITDGYVDIETLLDLGPEYYSEYTPSYGFNDVSWTADKLIYTSGTPVLYESYNLFIISLPDGVHNSFPDGDYVLGDFFLQYNDVMPAVSIVGSSGSGADIHVQFPMFENEDDLELYRIVIAKADQVLYPDDMYAPSVLKRKDVLPTGTDINVNLGVITYDMGGDVIVPGQAYKVYVGLKFDGYPDYYSLSEPSAEFTLTDQVGIEDANMQGAWVVAGNYLQSNEPVNQPTTLKIVSMSGQVVFQTPIEIGVQSVLLPNLPKGMYLATLLTSEGQDIVRFNAE